MNRLHFVEADYLAANPDVAAAVEIGEFSSGLDHFEKFGKHEGRKPGGNSGFDTRQQKVFHLLDRKGIGLEIGPSHNPIAPKSAGFNVHTLDHACAADLRRKYQAHGVDIRKY